MAATPTLRAIHDELSLQQLFGAEELLLQLRARHKFIKGCQERVPEQVRVEYMRTSSACFHDMHRQLLFERTIL
eukprot:COSAG05_NODE_17422_length_325_cov_0.920354_1_plen_73_part_01